MAPKPEKVFVPLGKHYTWGLTPCVVSGNEGVEDVSVVEDGGAGIEVAAEILAEELATGRFCLTVREVATKAFASTGGIGAVDFVPLRMLAVRTVGSVVVHNL